MNMDNFRFLSNKQYFADGQPMLRGFRKEQTDSPLHQQEFAEIVFVLNGEADYQTAPTKESYEKISRGAVLIVPAGGMHGYSNCRDLEIFALMFYPNYLPLPLLDLYIHPHYRLLFGRAESYYEKTHKNYPRLDFDDEAFAEFEHLLELFLRFQRNDFPGHNCETLGVFMCILGRLCDLWQQEEDLQQSYSSMNVTQILSYMAQNIDRDISLPELAAKNSMSVNTFLRHFRKTIGKTPMAYMRELRLKTSEDLLLHSRLQVEEIAFRCGFNNTSYFIATFKKYFGKTPENYRIFSMAAKRKG